MACFALFCIECCCSIIIIYQLLVNIKIAINTNICANDSSIQKDDRRERELKTGGFEKHKTVL